MKSVQTMSEKLYQQAGPQGQPGAGFNPGDMGGQPGGGDNGQQIGRASCRERV